MKAKGVIALIRFFLLAAVLFMILPARGESVAGDLEKRFGADRIEYEGKSYRPKKRITTVLLIGTDRRAAGAARGGYRSGGQADFLALLVIDDNADTITPVLINRDTMTEITALTAFGQESAAWVAQICLAHGFGDGGEQSCDLTAAAVSRYLMDVSIDSYIALNLDGIAAFNDALGGVPVTLTEDFSAYDQTMPPGESLTLKGVQAEYFVRMRYDVGDQTNTSRLARQRQYIESCATVLRERFSQDAGFMGALYDALEPYIVTNMARGRMMNIANRARRYEIRPVAEIDGESRLGESGFMEFYPDAQSLAKVVLEIFYDPAE